MLCLFSITNCPGTMLISAMLRCWPTVRTLYLLSPFEPPDGPLALPCRLGEDVSPVLRPPALSVVSLGFTTATPPHPITT